MPVAYEIFAQAVEDMGYVAFFLALCLGLIGLPIPNEAVVMTGGALAASELLAPVPAFIVIYLGISCGLTFGYGVGRATGSQLGKRFERKKNFTRALASSQRLSKRYGSLAISFSIFLPLLRHITMYAVGLNKLPYLRFASFAYVTAFLWTLVYFLIGMFLSDYVDTIGGQVNRYGTLLVWGILGAGAVYAIYRILASRKRKEEERTLNS